MKNYLSALILFLFSAAHLPSAFGQGSLTPPGPPAPTMKTLDQLDAKLEKRIDLLTVAGDGTANHVITQPGSYYLTANLNGSSGKAGVRVDTGDVTIDLNGFSLQGGSFSGDGVEIIGGSKNVRVTNGSVRGWNVGIRSNSIGNHMFDHLRLSGNRGGGLIAGGTGNIISNCAANANTGVGLQLGENGMITDSTATANTVNGIVAGVGSRVVRCNGSNNGASGIRVSTKCLVLENDCRDNPTAGIFVDGTDNRIENNTCSGNGNGIRVTGISNLIVKNSASTNPANDAAVNGSNYNIVAGNHIGKIAIPSANSSGTNTGLGTDAASPWANFSF